MSIHADEEKWIPIDGYVGRYEVSNYGNVRSHPTLRKVLARDGKTINYAKWPGRNLKPVLRSDGRYQVSLCGDGGIRKEALIHALVLEAFVGPRPEGMNGLHGDGNSKNNNLSNLRWGTQKENIDDAIKHGTQVMGESHGMRKLSKNDVLEIRAAGRRETQRLAEKFGVTRSAISRARNRYTWKSVA